MSAQSTTDYRPPVEAFANGGRVWLAGCADCINCAAWTSFRTLGEVNELIAALEVSKLQAWPKLKPNDTN
jgi:hypothetical protein